MQITKTGLDGIGVASIAVDGATLTIDFDKNDADADIERRFARAAMAAIDMARIMREADTDQDNDPA